MTPRNITGMAFRHGIRIFLTALAAVLLVLFIIPMFIGITNIGNIFGAVCCVFFILWANNAFLIAMQKHAKACKIFLRCLYGLVAIGLVYAIAVSGCMLYAAVKTPAPGSTVIVLGCKVNGTSPSLMLSKRLEAAETYLKENPDAVCIVSGGQGPDEGISEAQCMYNYLTAHGIDGKRIYMEDRSTSTDENMRFSQQIITEKQLSPSLAVVTDGFHELRASIIAEKNNITQIGAVLADTPFYLLPTYWVREWFALPVAILQ